MAVDREFESVLEAWARAGEERQARRGHIARRAAEIAVSAGDRPSRRAEQWARMTTFVPYSSMPFEEGEPDAQPGSKSQ